MPHFCKIQDKDADFYRQFQIIVLGLDSLEARRWINDMMCSLMEYEDDGNVSPGTNIPMVDGGTEGLAGHVNVIYPGITPCFECILPLFPPQVNFPMCTLADIPRTPAHCVEWAKQLEWDRSCPPPLPSLRQCSCSRGHALVDIWVGSGSCRVQVR